jgi:hypothetical protein
MRLFLTASADNTIYQRNPETNSGLDEILEVGKVANPEDLEIAYSSSAARILVNFKLPASGSIPETSSFYLNLKIANAQKLPFSQEIEIYQISGSWAEGSGYYTQRTVNPGDGSTWRQSNTSVSWSIDGGDYYVSPSTSVVLDEYPLQDLRIDVSNIMQSFILNNTNWATFSGLLVKFPDTSEVDYNNKGNIKFFSKQTHTIHAPILEAVWNDTTFVTGSLKRIPNAFDIQVVPKNVKETYVRGSKEKVRFVVRDKYPQKNFNTELRYKNVYYLPSSSYFSIVDRQAGTVVSPADQFATINCDATGSYFILDTSNLYRNRYYAVNLEINNGDSDTNILHEVFTFLVK